MRWKKCLRPKELILELKKKECDFKIELYSRYNIWGGRSYNKNETITEKQYYQL